MVQEIREVVAKYQDRLRELQSVPRLSHGRGLQRSDGAPNRKFLTCLFCHHELTIQFLKDVGFIRSKVQCKTCERDMTWSADPSRDGFRWRCYRSVAGVRCRASTSIRHGSWFQLSNLTFAEIMVITYDILCREAANQIENEYNLSDHTVADWGMFCREAMLDYLAGSSQKIGGPNRVVEIDESKIGRRKYNRGHPVQGQWVFGGVERGSGRTFLVPVPDRTADTLAAIIREWIEPGTTVISDCWGAYRDLCSQGYTHRTTNRSLCFVDPDTGDHTNTIQSTSHHLTVLLEPYNKAEDYRYRLAHYIFAARCREEGIPPFLQFLHIIASTDWSCVGLTSSSAPAT